MLCCSDEAFKSNSSHLYKLANRENSFLTNIQPVLCKIHNKLMVLRNNISPFMSAIITIDLTLFYWHTFFLFCYYKSKTLPSLLKGKNGHNHWRKSSKLVISICVKIRHNNNISNTSLQCLHLSYYLLFTKTFECQLSCASILVEWI